MTGAFRDHHPSERAVYASVHTSSSLGSLSLCGLAPPSASDPPWVVLLSCFPLPSLVAALPWLLPAPPALPGTLRGPISMHAGLSSVLPASSFRAPWPNQSLLLTSTKGHCSHSTKCELSQTLEQLTCHMLSCCPFCLWSVTSTQTFGSISAATRLRPQLILRQASTPVCLSASGLCTVLAWHVPADSCPPPTPSFLTHRRASQA